MAGWRKLNSLDDQNMFLYNLQKQTISNDKKSKLDKFKKLQGAMQGVQDFNMNPMQDMGKYSAPIQAPIMEQPKDLMSARRQALMNILRG